MSISNYREPKSQHYYKLFRVKRKDGRVTTVSIDPILVTRAAQAMTGMAAVGRLAREAALLFEDHMHKNCSGYVAEQLRQVVMRAADERARMAPQMKQAPTRGIGSPEESAKMATVERRQNSPKRSKNSAASLAEALRGAHVPDVPAAGNLSVQAPEVEPVGCLAGPYLLPIADPDGILVFKILTPRMSDLGYLCGDLLYVREQALVAPGQTVIAVVNGALQVRVATMDADQQWNLAAPDSPRTIARCDGTERVVGPVIGLYRSIDRGSASARESRDC